MRLFTEPKLVLASHNQGKLREIRGLLEPFPLQVVSAADLDLPEPEENGETFSENALIKARAAAEATGLPALSDDSGFCVDALDGAPGIHSARWAGPDKDFAKAMRNIEEKMQLKSAQSDVDRGAQFVAVLALVWPDGHEETFEGIVEGVAIWPPRGEMGFGYDPMFLPADHDRTFGEMNPEEKHGYGAHGGEGLSHRARAFKKLVDGCFRH